MRLTPSLRAVVFASATLACLPAMAQMVNTPGVTEVECNLYEMRRPRPLSVAAARTWLKLASPTDLPFEDGISLDDACKYIRQATAGPNSPGLAIFVDPAALRKNHATMESTVSLNVQGIPLASSLRLLLGQVNLGFGVDEDGVVIVRDKGEIPFSQSRPVTKAQAETWIALDRRVDVAFENKVNLGEFVKFLKASTGDDVVSVFVDPVSLKEHDLTGEETMVLDVKGVPLSTALALMLAQIDLTFIVQKDGILVILHKDNGGDEDGERDDTPDLRALVQENRIDLEKLRREVRAFKSGEASPKNGPKGGAAMPGLGGSAGSGGGFR